MNKQKRIEIFSRFKQINPNPTTELQYSSPFELLIAVILSAQATDVGVNKATIRLYKVANTPAQIYALGLDTLKDYIKTIGLFNTKAANIIKTCKLLINKHNSQIPNNRKELEALPGVGRKTANVVLNTAFGQATMAVDTHIFRVSKRTKIAHGKDVLQVEKSLVRLIPKEYLMDAHHWLILHGRYICKARKPNCKECIINDLCEYYPNLDIENTIIAQPSRSL
ncbi:MAG: endonuclease III [Proteobacteria bacterium]|nr:endonuclease III [Pseudomonadota bacterium]